MIMSTRSAEALQINLTTRTRLSWRTNWREHDKVKWNEDWSLNYILPHQIIVSTKNVFISRNNWIDELSYPQAIVFKRMPKLREILWVLGSNFLMNQQHLATGSSKTIEEGAFRSRAKFWPLRLQIPLVVLLAGFWLPVLNQMYWAKKKKKIPRGWVLVSRAKSTHYRRKREKV